MASALTFGVEWEMSVVCGYENSHPDPSEQRIVRIGNQDKVDDNRFFRTNGDEFLWETVARHMAATLRAAGFDSSVHSKGFTTWDFSSDVSVCEPASNRRYTYESIELRSPAMYFTPASLRAVEEVLTLLTSTYCINTNPTTGLHVHVGDSTKGWPFHMMRKLIAFLWAFTHQLNTLFPPFRMASNYTHPIRTHSRYAQRFDDEGPSPTLAILAILKCDDAEKLHYLFDATQLRFMENILHVQGIPNCKPTIEFRQHQGTMDPRATIMWVKTMVGIMEFLRDVQPADFTSLLSIVEHEHWEKQPDQPEKEHDYYEEERDSKHDVECERDMGPILAESGFTVIDLLRTMGLHEPARYYKQRGLYKHRALPRPFKWNSRVSSWIEDPDPKNTGQTEVRWGADVRWEASPVGLDIRADRGRIKELEEIFAAVDVADAARIDRRVID
ncbi:hypothetical protein M430DRAFT_41435 [Amorphotheca resinae ATCC 22711]|jgi:hypothetical protein|uniref:Amidoligase enzyme n=1 Tax=Amorphotheca resinae ATCC 22711 TaxID=857342 RepID=A0A2T3B351_AMORE|nr:hypothetical protein M430DRAFT_41435 [Amorphotheca resinae ATCC 22711]PSS20077.1 hypothetical protein M430DRAFT_41435 [Amorphotheca resinae ATCC 22711]